MEFLKNYVKKNKFWVIFTGILISLIIVLQVLRTSMFVREYVFSRGISRYILMGLSKISNLVPFSLSEFFIYIGVAFVLAIIVKGIIFLRKKDFSKALKTLNMIVAFALSINLVFLTLFTMSYERESLQNHLPFEIVEPNMELTKQAAIFFAEETIALEDKFEISEDGEVVSPYSFQELSALILKEYERLDDDFFSPFVTKPKRLAFGFVNSYFGFTGFYFPLFAESNINTFSTTHTLPVTMAHELAHSKGVMRESEANFLAYYLLITSSNDYLRFCGLYQGSSKLLSECYDANDRSHYDVVLSHLSDKWIAMNNYSYEFWQNYESVFDKIGNYFNNLYLKSSGIPSGTKNYSETGHFLVSLYKFLGENNG